MISVTPVAEPAAFDERCRQAGTEWQVANPDKLTDPRDYWSPFKKDLRRGFMNLCGYAAMYCPTGGQVDHYVSVKNDPSMTYEWSNYRYCSSTMNGIKRNKDSQALDPYVVPDGWFQIILPSLQMILTDSVPPGDRARAQYMLDEMKLGNDERLIDWRQGWYEAYTNGGMTLEQLRKWAPLIAEAINRRIAAGALR